MPECAVSTGHVAMKTALHALALCLITALPAFSQGAATVNRGQNKTSTPAIDYETAHLNRIVTAVRTTEDIALDGRLDEAAWRLATPATDFVQKVPVTGRLETERTEVRFLYDAENLYIGVICFDSDVSGLTVNDLEQDFSNRSSDNIHIAIDSLHERRSSFTFRTNPAGAKADIQISDGVLNYDWDAVWDVRTSINDEGWIAEFVVPFKTLRFSTASTQVWGLQMTRKIIRKSEEIYWSPVPVRYGLPRTSIYGTLEGLENITPGLNLKITPFVTAGVTQLRPAAASGGFNTRRDYDGGFDLKYSATPSLTVDATYRTDFAQVEVDQQQVNLTRFSLFFPEKRDFFIENARTFTFGAGTNLVPFFSRRIGLSPAGAPVPIVGGARLSGRAGSYEVGVIGMQTERSGPIPPTSYLVGRVKRNLWTNSWIGAIGTSRNSTLRGDFNRVYGADAHLEFYERLSVDSHVLKSDTPGLSRQNLARQLEMSWRDDEVTLAAGYNELQPHFNPEVGFIRRANNTRYNGNGSWNPILENSDGIRNLTLGASVEYYEAGGTGKIETRANAVNLGVDFENNATISFVATDTFDRLLEPFAIRPNTAIATGDYSYLDYSAQATSNPGRRIAGTATVEWGEFWDGDRTSVRGGLDVKPNHHLSLGFNYQRDHVELPVGQFTSNLVGARVRYVFTPRAFLVSFFQYNWTTRRLSSNVRLNLIHRPLSDLFVVYNDIRDPSGRSLQRALIFKLTNLIDF